MIKLNFLIGILLGLSICIVFFSLRKYNKSCFIEKREIIYSADYKYDEIDNPFGYIVVKEMQQKLNNEGVNDSILLSYKRFSSFYKLLNTNNGFELVWRRKGDNILTGEFYLATKDTIYEIVLRPILEDVKK